MHANLVTFSQFSAAVYVHRGISTFGAFIITVLVSIGNLKSVTLKLYVCVRVCLFVFFCLPVKAKMTNLNEV